MNTRPLENGDVVRIQIKDAPHGEYIITGVVNRIDGNHIKVFPKGSDLGIWFRKEDCKRIGRVKKDSI